ncbi:Mannan endo-1,6-alpha-mannosidase [Paramyrothecium foliicola]|nr:Mannan endo-1,6-alpha-mannosidase [Paramyrothecium foliicola]
MAVTITTALLATLLCSPAVAGAGLAVGSRDETLKSSSLIAEDLMELYHGKNFSGVPGLLPDPYYWFQSGLLMGSFVDYWRLSGDDQFNELVKEGMLFQASGTENFMPENQTRTIGNDDQCLWALSALLAAENDFPSPSKDELQWLDLAKNTFEDMKVRLDNEGKDSACDGGLRWQIFPFNAGYDYKNTISNGCLLNLGAGLAKATGNSTYSKTAEEQWKWLETVGLIDSKKKAVYTGISVEDDECGEPEEVSFSSETAILAQGAAYMYNHVADKILRMQTDGSDTWRERVSLLTDILLSKFFSKDGILEESFCEPEVCNLDLITMRSFTARTLTHIVELAPFLGDKINPVIKTSGEAAAKQCTRTDSDEPCGFVWTTDKYLVSKSSGVGEQMNALAAISNLLSLPGDKPSEKGSPQESTGGEGSSTDPAEETPTGAGSPPAESTEPSGAGHNAISGMLVLVLVSGVALLSL